MKAMKNHLKNIAKLVGLSSLIAFTGYYVFVAVVSKGVQFYYYEPNTTVLISEVFLGIYGVCTGTYIVKEIID